MLSTQGGHHFHDDQPGDFPCARLAVHVWLQAPQADVGWVELGSPGGLVALYQAGHPGSPHDWAGVVELRDWRVCPGDRQQDPADHTPQHP